MEHEQEEENKWQEEEEELILRASERQEENHALQIVYESLTIPEPLNWTFTQDLHDIDITSIGMDTEQTCLNFDLGSEHFETFQNLQRSLQQLDMLHKWFVLPSECIDKIQLCTCNVNAVGSPVICYTIEILLNCEWLLRIPQGVIQWKSHPVLKDLPVFINSINDVREVTDTIDYAKHCPGINDGKYNSLVASHKGKFYNRAGEVYI